ncbi:MAG: MBOAT family protein [Oscillospiraceae bacterium]|nr:MBOAT family protein [Oscillospiraceae bacterium]
MVFSSLIFLYAFLPLCLIAYALCHNLKAKNICLLVFSIIFYTWGEPKYILLLIAMSFFDWLFALLIQHTEKTEKKKRKCWLTLACIVNLGLIGLFKYGKMLFATVGYVPAFVENLTLPLGISFYTFQLLSYVIDVYRGEAEAQKEYWHVLLFAALYHQCIAGPIVRYKTIANELFVSRDDKADLAKGCFRFSLGLAKKVLLANTFGELANSLLLSDTVLSDSALFSANNSALSNVSVTGTWIGLIVATLQMYYDFSAYSEMAIGLGLMVGLHYPENFNYPYIAKTANEYWRRWHMTLGQWFRDYLYYPLTLGPAMKIRKFFTKKTNRKTGMFMQNLFTMLVIWSCTGLWHGAAWSYVLWGLYWCFFMLLEQSFLQKWLEKIPGVFSHIYLFILLMLERTFFRFGDLRYSLTVVKSMFGLNGNSFSDFSSLTLLKNNLFLIVFGIIAATPAIKLICIYLKKKMSCSNIGEKMVAFVEYAVIPVVLLILSTGALVGGSYNPFLYYRF